MCTPYEEPHYGLMVVACDRCGRVCATRKTTGIAAWWRRVMQWRDAMFVLLLQVGGLCISVGGITLLVFIVEGILTTYDITPYQVIIGGKHVGFFDRIERLYLTGDAYVVMAMAFMCAAAGTWIATTLRSIRVWWSCVIVTLLAIAVGQVWAWLFFESGSRARIAIAFNSAVLTLLGAIAVCGATPLGMVLRGVLREASRVAFGWKLGRARKRRKR
jgi:hypothetical protein